MKPVRLTCASFYCHLLYVCVCVCPFVITAIVIRRGAIIQVKMFFAHRPARERLTLRISPALRVNNRNVQVEQGQDFHRASFSNKKPPPSPLLSGVDNHTAGSGRENITRCRVRKLRRLQLRRNASVKMHDLLNAFLL